MISNSFYSDGLTLRSSLFHDKLHLLVAGQKPATICICGSYEHMPNLCVSHKVCSKCMYEDVTRISECDFCGKNEFVFSGTDTVDAFCDWMFSEDNCGAIVLCHNFQGYDSYPILKYLYKN